MRGTLIRLSSKNLSFDKNEVNPFLFRSSDMVLRVLLNMCLITMLTLLFSSQEHNFNKFGSQLLDQPSTVT